MTAAAPQPSTMRRDLASAYAVTAARVLAWVVVSAVVYRKLGEAAFAMFALGRATIGLLAYTSLGLAPAMMRLLAETRATAPSFSGGPTGRAPNDAANPTPAPPPGPPLHEQTTLAYEPTPTNSRVYDSGSMLAVALTLVGGVILAVYALNYPTLHVVPPPVKTVQIFVLLLGVGMLARLASDVPSAVLQTHGRIAVDNVLQAFAELLWMALSVWLVHVQHLTLVGVGLAYAIANVALGVARFSLAARHTGIPNPLRARLPTMLRLLSFGVLVMFSQTADFLYAPVDYIMINRLLSPAQVGHYAPAVQIDGALALAVSGAAAVLLPYGALAHAAGRRDLLRTYYVRGTLLGVAVVLPLAVLTWLASPWIFRLWLGDPMPQTQAILPWVLLHNLIGCSAFAGRSILLGMGRVVPFTVSVLAAGIGNVILSFTFVTYFDMGMRGIVFGTIVVVFVRCVLWQPWYVLRAIRQTDAPHAPVVGPEVVP